MSDFFRWLDAHQPIALLLGLLWIGGWVFASILVRRHQEKPIIPRTPENARFSERWTSGSSLRNILTRLGGARNCLLVAVTDRELIVTPLFPFNLMFLPEIYDLEYRARRADVRIEKQGKGWLNKAVVLEIRDQAGDRTRVSLRLRNPQGFVAALQAR